MHSNARMGPHKEANSSYLIEITLQKELFENINKFRHRRKSFLEIFNEFHRSETVVHVEADVDFDAGFAIRQFDDRHL